VVDKTRIKAWWERRYGFASLRAFDSNLGGVRYATKYVLKDTALWDIGSTGNAPFWRTAEQHPVDESNELEATQPVRRVPPESLTCPAFAGPNGVYHVGLAGPHEAGFLAAGVGRGKAG
jgi:hypothetical protein